MSRDLHMLALADLEKENERLRSENGLLWEGNAHYRDVLGEVANQEIMTRTVTTNEVRLVLLARQALEGEPNE